MSGRAVAGRTQSSPELNAPVNWIKTDILAFLKNMKQIIFQYITRNYLWIDTLILSAEK